MKRCMAAAIVVIALLAITACGSKKDNRTLQDFIKVYEDNGTEIDPEEKPIFQMISAVNGVIFYMDDKPVKIYEYKSEKELEQAKKDYTEMMKDWPANGKFLLETSNEDATDIFKGIE